MNINIELEKFKQTPFFERREDLLLLGISLVKKDGLWLEFGVAGGCSANLIAKNTKNTLYGFDSFDGLPEDWTPWYKKGQFKQDKLPNVLPNVKLVIGGFEETFPKFKQEPKDLAFIHIDSDLYNSAKSIFKWFGDSINSGTVIIFDELYNYEGFENHEIKAWLEFVVTRDLHYSYFGYSKFSVGLIIL